MLCGISQEDLWYRAGDFERFKQDVLQEAKSAGCNNPQAQYEHIKRKFQDADTLKNTAMNLVRTKSNSNDGCHTHTAGADDEASSTSSTSSTSSLDGADREATEPEPRRTHHKRSVSWGDFDQEDAVPIARIASQTAGASDELRRIMSPA